MGSGSSRMSVRSPRPRSNNRPKPGLASFLCVGGASSSSFPRQMEDEAPEQLVIPGRLHDAVANNNLRYSIKECSSSVTSENNSSSTAIGHQRSFVSNDDGFKDHSMVSDDAEASHSGKCFSESKELVPSLASAGPGLAITHPESTSDLASSSSKLDHLEPLLTTGATAIGPLRVVDDSTVDPVSNTSSVRFSRSFSQVEPGEALAGLTLTTENPSDDVLGFQGEYSDMTYAGSTSSLNLMRDGPLLATTTSTADLITLGERSGNVLRVDVVSISSSTQPSGSGDIINSESRRNSRLFWDAFSMRGTRRNYDSAALISSAEDTDDLESHDRWLLDISDDNFRSRFDHNSVYLHHGSHGANGRRWHHSRSEIRERLLGSFDDDTRRTTLCPSGLHPDGTCSCDSLLVTDESSRRTSISRIVLLAEALFEVLDEIHRQPVSLSMVSLPAPESVVNSLPLKSCLKLDTAGIVDDVDQCYICLAEYEEDDKIRVLPCNHEYHMTCVDKWLKEIHGVCPLCRRDVHRDPADRGSLSDL